MLGHIAIAAGFLFGATFVAGIAVFSAWDEPPIAFAWFYFIAQGLSVWVLIIVGVVAAVRECPASSYSAFRTLTS